METHAADSRTAHDIVMDYLDRAIAAEKSFEMQLQGFARNAQKWETLDLFQRHAEETRLHYQMLTDRLSALGAVPSGLRSFLCGIFNTEAQLSAAGHSDEECQTQDLVVAYSFENSKIAMYEALAGAAAAAGDAETERLARRIQERGRQTAARLWEFIAPAARDSIVLEKAADWA